MSSGTSFKTEEARSGVKDLCGVISVVVPPGVYPGCSRRGFCRSSYRSTTPLGTVSDGRLTPTRCRVL